MKCGRGNALVEKCSLINSSDTLRLTFLRTATYNVTQIYITINVQNSACLRSWTDIFIGVSLVLISVVSKYFRGRSACAVRLFEVCLRIFAVHLFIFAPHSIGHFCLNE